MCFLLILYKLRGSQESLRLWKKRYTTKHTNSLQRRPAQGGEHSAGALSHEHPSGQTHSPVRAAVAKHSNSSSSSFCLPRCADMLWPMGSRS